MSSSSVSRSKTRQSSDTPAKRIAFIQSCWHRDIVDQSRLAFLKGLKKRGYGPGSVDCFEVPGAFEIPLQAKLLAKTGQQFHEHDEHRAFFRRHFITKGNEAALACAATIDNIRSVKARVSRR
jgi:6,7-dimethyl-8-ribityllumazine synthase